MIHVLFTHKLPLAGAFGISTLVGVLALIDMHALVVVLVLRALALLVVVVPIWARSNDDGESESDDGKTHDD
jgi:hypothetical protein